MIQNTVTTTAAQARCLAEVPEDDCELSVEKFGGHGWLRVTRLDGDGWPASTCYVPPEGGPALTSTEAADTYRQRCGVDLEAAV